MSLKDFKTLEPDTSGGESVDSDEQQTSREPFTERYFGEDSVNRAPQEEVDVKHAVDLNIYEDKGYAYEVAVHWNFQNPDDYVEVFRVTFNDGSTFNWPLLPWDSDKAYIRQGLVEQYAPDVIRHCARQRGDDPQEAFENSRFYEEDEEPEWCNRVRETQLTDEQRKWFNENAEYTKHLMRTVDSDSNNVELDVEDDEDWADDW